MRDDLFGLEKPHKIADGDEVELLTTVYDLAALGMVRGLLEDADIPYLVRERGTGSAMRLITGFSLYGSDIFVPTNALGEAEALISGLFAESDGEVEFLEDAESESCDTDEAADTEADA